MKRFTESMKRFTRFLAAMLPLLAVTAGCHGQATVTPPPTVSVSDTVPSGLCPSGYTCAYILSWAPCTGSAASTCPTPGNPGPGPYTPLQTAANALSSPSYTGPAPAQGQYLAFTFQVVFTNLSPAWVGPPSPISTPELIAFYPGTLGAPTSTTTAALAPPIEDPGPQVAMNGAMPQLAVPKVTVRWDK